mgnify:FL=1
MSQLQIMALSVGALETNCYILYDCPGGSGYVVDPGDEPQRLLQAVQALSLHILGVVLTHAHFDHMLAADAVCRATGAELLVGAGDEPALTDACRNLTALLADGTAIPPLRAGRRLYEGDTLPLGACTLRVLETPGHTPGGICLDTGEWLLSGDTLFCRSVGRTDFPGGDAAVLRRSLKKLAELPGDRRVYPGHGEPTTLEDERKNNGYMAEAWK